MFKIKEALNNGWEIFKANTELAIFTTLILLAVGSFTKSHMPIGILATIFAIILQIGYNKIYIRLHDGETPIFTDIFGQTKLFWKYLLLSLLNGFVVVFGLILLIIPGLIFAIRLSFASMILIDTNIGPIEAIKESWAITKGSFWKLLGFWFVIGAVNILGAICLFVGLLVTVPVSALAMVYVYRKLSQARASLIVEPITSTPIATV